MRSPVTVRCECGNVSYVADLEAAVHWAFCECLMHGVGCDIDIMVDITLHVQHIHEQGQPSCPG